MQQVKEALAAVKQAIGVLDTLRAARTERAMSYISNTANWYYVLDSTNISAISYYHDRSTLMKYGRLYMATRKGRLYEYLNVPPTVYEAFLKAPSKGRFVHQNLIGVYPALQIGGHAAGGKKQRKKK